MLKTLLLILTDCYIFRKSWYLVHPGLRGRFWLDSTKTLFCRKTFKIEEIHVEKVVHFGDLIAIADKFIKRRKWTIQQINPDDFWVKSKQKFEFRYFYKDSRIKVDWPFPEENSIALLAETALRQKGLKRNTLSDKKKNSYQNHIKHKKKKSRKFIRKQQNRIAKKIGKTNLYWA